MGKGKHLYTVRITLLTDIKWQLTFGLHFGVTEEKDSDQSECESIC